MNGSAIAGENLRRSAEPTLDGPVHVTLPGNTRVFAGKKDALPWECKQIPSRRREGRFKERGRARLIARAALPGRMIRGRGAPTLIRTPFFVWTMRWTTWRRRTELCCV